MLNPIQRASMAKFCYDLAKGGLLAPLAQSWLTGLKPEHLGLYLLIVVALLLLALHLETGE